MKPVPETPTFHEPSSSSLSPGQRQFAEELSPSNWRGELWISLVFLALVLAQWFFLDRYWSQTLQPRLYQTAETQAGFLAQSQARVLTETLEHSQPEQLESTLFNLVQEILVITDASTQAPLFLGISITLDDMILDIEPGSLDLVEGRVFCEDCFLQSQPLIFSTGELVGVVDFYLSQDTYRALSADMKARLFRESGVVLGVLVVVWISMLVVFRRLHRARVLIEASDRAKTRFLANVTHEFRTPLNGILGYTQIFKEDAALMAKQGRGVNTIDRCAEHLLLLINDILDFSKTDDASLQIHPRSVALKEFLRTLVEMAEIRAQQKNLRFVCEFPQQLPAQVEMDDQRLRQILLNLIGNAIKFTLEGQVSFSLKVYEPANSRALFRFTVKDTGIGIAAEDLKKIFVPFQQVDNAITRAEGSGLGLSISQRLVDIMGSRLQVSSTPGEGSCFWFDLHLRLTDDRVVDIACDAYRESMNKTVQSHPMPLPDKDSLNLLMEAARLHNVTACKALMTQLRIEPEMAAFVAQAEDMIAQYRFKPLIEWLTEIQDPS